MFQCKTSQMHRSLLLWHTLTSITQNVLLHSFLAFNSFHWTLWNSASIIRGKLSLANFLLPSNSSLYVFFNFLLFQKTDFPSPRPLPLIQPSRVGIFLFIGNLTPLNSKLGSVPPRPSFSDCSHITLQWCAGQTWTYSWELTVHVPTQFCLW